MEYKSIESREDNPNRYESTTGTFAKKYWKAMKTDIATLGSMVSWKIVERGDNMNDIQSKWAYKCKRFLDGLIKTVKAQFCDRGNQQL